VPLFEFPRTSPERAGLLLAETQEQYGLSDIFLYRSGNGSAAICLRTFPLRRLEKIIRASGSANYGTLVKYRHLFFRVGEVRDENQDLLSGPPEFIRIIPATDENNARYISRPHFEFLKDFVPFLREYPRMHGKGPVILTHTINEL
jgi:hypothetical protein